MGGPLRDLRIVEFAGLGAAPFCAMLLADLGADVLRLERPAGASGRAWTEQPLRRGRPSVAIDLKHAAAAGFVLDLVARADAIVEGFRPGVMERFGLGPDVCIARNPRLVYGRMTGWGQSGPNAPLPGHDLNYIALSGALASVGRPGELPVPPVNLVGDFGGGGLLLAFGIVSAVLAARQSGRGQVVDAAMSDGSALLMTMIYELRNLGVWTAERGTNLLDGGAPFYDVYRTSDGRAVAVGCLEEKFYTELLRRLELDSIADLDYLDRSNWPALRAALTSAFAILTSSEIETLFAGADSCVTIVADIEDAPSHPHNVARATFYETESGPLPSPAPRFEGTPSAAPLDASELDGRQALRSWGVADTEISDLASSHLLVLSE